LEDSLVFQGFNAVANVATYGYDVTILIDVCKAIIRAEAEGKLLKRQKNLTRAQRASSGNERRKRLHQFLSDIGVKALRQHLGQLLGIAQVSRSEAEYEGHVRTIFGRQYEIRAGRG
jgi:hypothetical protein